MAGGQIVSDFKAQRGDGWLSVRWVQGKQPRSDGRRRHVIGRGPIGKGEMLDRKDIADRVVVDMIPKPATYLPISPFTSSYTLSSPLRKLSFLCCNQ